MGHTHISAGWAASPCSVPHAWHRNSWPWNDDQYFSMPGVALSSQSLTDRFIASCYRWEKEGRGGKRPAWDLTVTEQQRLYTGPLCGGVS